MSAEKRLRELNIVLPASSTPAGSYAKVIVLDGLAHLSGQGPRNTDGSPVTGQVPSVCSLEDAIAAARNVGFFALAALREEVGSLDRVQQIIRTFGMVNAATGFSEHPKVIDGFSNLMIEVFGEAGRGARSAVGMSSLPFNISVEVEMTVKLFD
jgi:enamine deaminase RidA (YjgF/YER057c/UK114 family)